MLHTLHNTTPHQYTRRGANGREDGKLNETFLFKCDECTPKRTHNDDESDKDDDEQNDKNECILEAAFLFVVSI